MNEDQEKKLQFAQEKISTAKLLLENEKFSDSISRSYYGMFHAAKALLLEKDSDPKTHSGTASELGKLFRDDLGIEMTREFSRIQEKREKADYGEIESLDKEEARKVLQTAEKFVSQADEILK